VRSEKDGTKFDLALLENLSGTYRHPGPVLCRAGGYDIDPEGQIMRLVKLAD